MNLIINLIALKYPKARKYSSIIRESVRYQTEVQDPGWNPQGAKHSRNEHYRLNIRAAADSQGYLRVTYGRSLIPSDRYRQVQEGSYINSRPL